MESKKNNNQATINDPNTEKMQFLADSGVVQRLHQVRRETDALCLCPNSIFTFAGQADIEQS